VDHQIVDLTVFRMQQNSATISGPAFRLVRLAEANGPPGLCTAARRRDRARPRRELGILLPLHGTVLIEMASAAPFVSSELTAPDVPEDQFRPNATFKPGLGG
jgi:hypothetical protein